MKFVQVRTCLHLRLRQVQVLTILLQPEPGSPSPIAGPVYLSLTRTNFLPHFSHGFWSMNSSQSWQTAQVKNSKMVTAIKTKIQKLSLIFPF